MLQYTKFSWNSPVLLLSERETKHRISVHWLCTGTQFPQKEAATGIRSEICSNENCSAVSISVYFKKIKKPNSLEKQFFPGSVKQLFFLRLYQKLVFCVNTVGLCTKDHAQKCCSYLGFWWFGITFSSNNKRIKYLFSNLSRRSATETKVKTSAIEQKEPEEGTEGVT